MTPDFCDLCGARSPAVSRRQAGVHWRVCAGCLEVPGAYVDRLRRGQRAVAARACFRIV